MEDVGSFTIRGKPTYTPVRTGQDLDKAIKDILVDRELVHVNDASHAEAFLMTSTRVCKEDSKLSSTNTSAD